MLFFRLSSSANGIPAAGPSHAEISLVQTVSLQKADSLHSKAHYDKDLARGFVDECSARLPLITSSAPTPSQGNALCRTKHFYNRA